MVGILERGRGCSGGGIIILGECGPVRLLLAAAEAVLHVAQTCLDGGQLLVVPAQGLLPVQREMTTRSAQVPVSQGRGRAGGLVGGGWWQGRR